MSVSGFSSGSFAGPQYHLKNSSVEVYKILSTLLLITLKYIADNRGTTFLLNK